MSTEVYMYRNVTVVEGDIAEIEIRRTGDLSGYTSGTFTLSFGSGAGYGDIEWYGVGGDASASYIENDNLGYYTFAPGEDRAILRFRLTDDAQAEDAERIYVELLTANGADIGDNRDYIEIEDNDSASTPDDSGSGSGDQVAEPTLSISNAVVDEGGVLRFLVTTDVIQPEDIWVSYHVTAGTAHVTESSGFVKLSAGTAGTVIELQTIADADANDEQVTVSIADTASSSVNVGDATAIGSINDDGAVQPVPLPEVIIDNVGTVNEGETADFTVRITGSFSEPVTVTLATYKLGSVNADGSDTDYDGIGDVSTPERVLTFTPGGATTQTVSVDVFTDAVADDGEQFELRVEAVSSNATFVSGERGVVTIADVAPDNGPDPDPTLPVFPLPDLTVASGNQAYPSDVQASLAREAIERLIQTTGDPLSVTNAYTFGVGGASEAASDYLWQQLQTNKDAVLKGSMFTPESVQVHEVFDDIVQNGAFAKTLGNLGVAGDAVGVYVSYNELAGDGFDSEDRLIMAKDVYNGVLAGSIASLATAGVLVVIGVTPVGWGVVLIGSTGIAVSLIASDTVEWIDPVTGLQSITSRPEDFNPFQLIEQTLEKVGTEVFGPGYDGGSTTTGGGSVVTPYVEYDADYNAVFDPNWYLDNVEISDQVVVTGEVVSVSFQVVQPEDLYNVEADFTVRYFLSEDEAISSDDVEFDSVTSIDDLPANQSANVDVSFAVGDGFDGDYHFLAEVQSSTYGEGAMVVIPVEIDGNSSGSTSGGSGGSGSGSNDGGQTGSDASTVVTLTVADAYASGSEYFDWRFADAMLDGDEIIIGSAERDEIVASPGDDIITGGAGVDQVTIYDVGITGFTWSIDADTGRLTSTHDELGFDQYTDAVHFWSSVSGWHSYDSVLALVENEPPATITTFNDGDGVAADPAQSWQWWDERFGVGPAYDGDEVIHGGAGHNDYLATPGDDVLHGTGSFDQYTIHDVSLSEMGITVNDAGNLVVTTSAFGTDELVGEFAAWIDADQAWLSYDELLDIASPGDPLTPQAGDTVFNDGDGVPADPAIGWQWWDERFGEGGSFGGDEFVFGGAGDDDYLISAGDDVFDGGAGYNQVTVLDDIGTFIFSVDPQTGYLASAHADYGQDLYAPETAFWFETGGWHSYEDMLLLV